jgi:hypothetical protein
MIYPIFGFFAQSTPSPVSPPDTSSLYDFTTFTFTNAGATGRQGPTYQQLTASYATTASWVTSSLYFSASIRGIQEWTVPATATYRIVAAGAAGGNSPTLNFSGGFGASVTTDISLTQNQKILIVVGQRGGNRFTGSGAATFNGGSGGGGTFVYDSSSITYYLAVGGGGGAAGALVNLFSNQATASGKFNTTSGSTVNIGSGFSGSGGFNGSGGFRSNRNILYGAPGAGINSSGSAANGGQGLSRVGNWLGGTTGSTSNINGVEGGFGGGGGAVDGDASGDPNIIGWAGGGGGYSGGGAGGNSGASNSSFGGGGGTFYTGSFVTGSSNINQGHGYVIITKL